MKAERTISAYKNYFRDFISSLTEAEARKVFYVIDIFRVFFIFDDGNVVMLFNGFQKKTQKGGVREIEYLVEGTHRRARLTRQYK